MAYKDIVVHLAPDARSSVRLDAAVELAERHEGKVTGLYVLPHIAAGRLCQLRALARGLQALDTEQRAHAEEAERGVRGADGQVGRSLRMAAHDGRAGRRRHDERALRRHHRRRPGGPGRRIQRRRAG